VTRAATFEATFDALGAALPGRVERDVSSVAYTTYRCGGPFAALVRVSNEDELHRVADVLHGRAVPVLVVGRGSNLLVADAGFRGLAIVLTGDFEQLEPDGRRGRVHSGGAVALPVLARRAAAVGVGGLEFFVGIPGSVGGAVRMNAGGHGRETKEVLVRARVYFLDDGRPQEVTVDDLDLGYRTSALGPRAIVVAATFAGRSDVPAACNARIDEIVRWRREHQPGGQNAGSVFTNPPDAPAGMLIETSGCKGLRVGRAVVSEKHANFFVAESGATAADVHALIAEVQRRVAAAHGVHLEPELHLIGFRSEVTT
jgi:UDP-N-acetylmuramate dehydrogenase